MCQTKAEGGRRCVGRYAKASNYPSVIDANHKTGTIELKSSSFVDNPSLALHAAVLAARTGYALTPETIQAGRDASEQFSKVSKAHLWEQWSSLLEAENPSKGLDAIHLLGWEKHFPELAAIRGVPQSPFWHPEGSVEIHTGQAADVAAELAKRDGLSKADTHVAVMGAICHDLGKSVSTVTDSEGKISSQGHAETGAPMAKRFLKRIGATDSVIRQVPLIVREHMCHINTPTKKAVRNLMTRLDNNGNGTTLELWARIAEADKAGRGSAGVRNGADEWLRVKKEIEAESVRPPKNFINGNLLKEAGLQPGPDFKTFIELGWKAMERGEITDKESALKWYRDPANLKNNR